MVRYGESSSRSGSGDPIGVRAKAAAWARSTGMASVPVEPHKFNGWICFGLALLWIFPAVIYALWCYIARQTYDQAVDNALRLWRENGMPEPSVQAQESAVSGEVLSNSRLTMQINELSRLKDSGAITDEEYSAAKKEILGI